MSLAAVGMIMLISYRARPQSAPARESSAHADGLQRIACPTATLVGITLGPDYSPTAATCGGVGDGIARLLAPGCEPLDGTSLSASWN